MCWGKIASIDFFFSEEMEVSDKSVFISFLYLRLISIFFVNTSFVPDEYWQSLEVSHKLAYSYGHLTWEWDKKIRSCCYPFVFYLLYNIIPDSTSFIIYSPRVLQAILSSVGDFFIYKFTSEYFGKSCAKWGAFNILTSWFLFYCSSRTLTNVAEMSLTSCGFYFYPWPKRKKCRLSTKYIWFAGASCVMRPTAFVVWIPLFIWHVARERNMFSLLRKSILIGCLVLGGMLCVDKWCYGEWVLTPYNFFVFNWSNDIGAFYGSHSLIWYFTSGLPVILGLHTIPFLYGLCMPQLKELYFLILWVLIVFSIPSHKEFRFLLPILPLCLIMSGVVMNEIWSGKLRVVNSKVDRNILRVFTVTLTLTHASVSLYMGVFHQRGVIDATNFLSEKVDANSKVLFLMPCHSTPYYSFIHKDIEMKFLSCEPNFENVKNHTEEAEEFFEHPSEWLSKNYEFGKATSVPSHIVMFDNLYPDISTFLSQHHYDRCFSAFHAHFAQGRTGRYVYIYCK